MNLTYEEQYLAILKRIVEEGERKQNRTGIDTLVIPPTTISHDFATGTFPMLTTKEMAMNSMAFENEGFIGGITDKAWYRKNKCNIWNEWARQDIINSIDFSSMINISNAAEVYGICMNDFNTRRPKIADKYPEKTDIDHNRMTFQYLLQDLGPIYGYQWRRFGKEYHEMVTEPIPPAKNLKEAHELGDQFSHMIHMLKTNPDDRRMKVEAWNFNQVKQQALPACHTDFTIQHINGTLHLTWQQRSVNAA